MSMLHKYRAGHVPRHQKTYLSREMTRAMSLDHPIGDPHGGPAYGERNDPVSAIISIATLVTTGGAVLAGTASLMTGLAFAGAAISLVGNITKNKTLSKIGMVVGIAGGAGMLAESAGLFTSATMGETFGYGAEAANAIPGGAPLDQSPVGGGNVAPDVSEAIVSPAASPAAPVVEPLAPIGAAPEPVDLGLVTSPVTSNLASPASVQTEGLINNAVQAPAAPLAATPGTPGTPGAPTAPGVNAPSTPNPFTAQTSTGLAALPGDSQAIAGPGFLDSLKAGNYADAASSAWDGIKGIGTSFMDLAKTNPGAAYMMGQTISSVGDVLSGKAGAQVDALEAQGELSKAQAEKLRFDIQQYQRRVGNLNNNYQNVQNPLANWKPNFQTQPAQTSGGLIGAAMQPATGG